MQDHVLGELIERAAKTCGSKTALAQKIGVSPQRINDWRTGFRQCPAEQAAIMADIAGMPAEEWLVRVTLLNSKEKPYHGRLEKALGKSLPWTGAETDGSLPYAVHSGLPGGTDGGFPETSRLSTMYIMLN